MQCLAGLNLKLLLNPWSLASVVINFKKSLVYQSHFISVNLGDSPKPLLVLAQLFLSGSLGSVLGAGVVGGRVRLVYKGVLMLVNLLVFLVKVAIVNQYTL